MRFHKPETGHSPWRAEIEPNASTVALTGTVIACMFAVASVSHIAQLRVGLATITGVTTVLVAGTAALLTRGGRSTTVASRALLAVTYLGLSTTIYVAGPFKPAGFGLAFFPTFALVLVGERVGIASAILATAQVLVVAIAKEPLPWHPNAEPGWLAILIIGCWVFVVSGMVVNRRVVAIVRTRSQLLSELVSARNEAERAKNEAERAKNEAERANAAKTAFLATMSHEIRSPLNGVLGTLDLLGSTALTREQQGYAQTMHSSGRLVRNVLDDLLDFAKVTAGQMNAVIEPTAVCELFRSTVEPFRARAQRKGIKLQLTIDPVVPCYVATDGRRLRQIVTNLVANALKFTTEGSVHVTVAIAGATLAEEGIHVVVADTGAGIAEHLQAPLFEPYRQGHAPCMGEEGGTGLGLAICRSICVLLGGRIWAESEEGSGSRFHVVVPAHRCEPIVRAEDSSARRGAITAEHLPMRVLIVDDEPVNQFVSQRMLEKLGHRVTVATSGEQAVELTARDNFDAVLTDVSMPGMNGIAMIRHLRAHVGRQLVIIVASAGAMENEHDKCFTAGADCYLTKPLDLKDLQVALNKAQSDR